MLFNSFEFIFLFLPCAALGYHTLRRADRGTLAIDWLIACSLFFYAWGNPKNLPVLLASLFANYALARWMGKGDANGASHSRRKRILIGGIAANLLLLASYKYSNHLPLGISFFTLMQVMYLVDCYEGMIAPNNLRDHALLVSFFPSVSMGPILRAKDTLLQFRAPAAREFDADLLARAILLFSIGLFKKAVIADSFARIADAGYMSPATLSLLEAWACSVSYCLQLYYDFSGYSDMAVAAALMLGINIPLNFNSPYQARSIIDFWKRWHISLSNFITSYLYTPIVRSFKKLSFEKAMFATLISMLIAGLWHGSTWNFIIFGALHGIALVVNQYRKKSKKKLPDGLAWALTFAYINVAFIFFRAHNISDALQVLRALGNVDSLTGTATLKLSIRASEIKELVLPISLGAALVFSKKNSNVLTREFQPSWKNLSWATLVTVISLLYLNSNMAKEFLYFEF
ncbi:alginate O-acetyltransferase complex protein AlgI [Oxalobacteraceae bacterium GrIS 1.11]